jgi:diaminohydroxyphosphoribosylaminopyrimidine deaminase / 5-amino-6-(5-phosphoribosylamino)uracil reductase
MFKEKYFQTAFELAEQGRGKCSPNPFVGAVIVKDNKVIGKGFTQPYGLDHAEVQAIKDAGNCQGAEIYVTLEPCAHFGKTPPCADAIIKAGISKVYAGIKDPNEKVNGKGFAKLKDAGIEVQYGIWEDKINRQLEYYITYITQQRPFVFMKNAVSKDGKIALSGGVQTQITGEETRKQVHELRNEADVILTGIGTVLTDDPMLNVRFDNIPPSRGVDDHNGVVRRGVLNPTRVILDTNLQIPIESKIVQTAKDIETIVFTRQDFQDEQDKIAELKTFGVEVVKTSYSKNGLDLKTVLNELYNRNFYSVMVEAGSKVCSSFVREKLVDKFYRFVSPKIIGGDFSLFRELNITEMKDILNLKTESVEKSGEDILIIGYPI